MIARLRTWGKGALEALLAMSIYAVTLGACMALMLLIISIEEGGPSLSIATVPLTETLILLTQGSGFTAGSLTLTIMPLLLTIGLLWLIKALVSWRGLSVGGCCLGTLTWMILNLVILQGTQTIQVDTTPVIILKAALVFLSGYALAVVTSKEFHTWWESAVQERIPTWLRRSVRLGLSWGAALVGLFLAAGLIALICWVVLYHGAVAKLFNLARMGPASSVVTSIASLAWLPTLVIWAYSWLMGDGFSIGELASFTLWSGHAKSLPSVPLFGLFPDPVADQGVRTLLLNIPLLAGLVLGVLLLLGSRNHRLFTAVRKHGVLSWTVIRHFLQSTLSMILAWMTCLIISCLVFLFSNGSLGTERLASVGVSIPASGKMIATSLGMGLMTSWVLAILTGSLLVLWKQVQSHIQMNGALVNGMATWDGDTEEQDEDNEPATDASSEDLPENRSQNSKRETNEGQSDHREGSGNASRRVTSTGKKPNHPRTASSTRSARSSSQENQ